MTILILHYIYSRKHIREQIPVTSRNVYSSLKRDKGGRGADKLMRTFEEPKEDKGEEYSEITIMGGVEYTSLVTS